MLLFTTIARRKPSEEGFALVGLIVVIFIILLTLSVAAPTVARALRRDREVEAVHRADAYVSAIRRYYLKNGSYPASLEQLEKTNNIRYLRQKYNDPMTGKPDWRLIKVGENKTTVKGFFGQPLAGLANTGIGSSSLSPSSTSPSGAGTFGSTGSSGASGAPGASVANTIDTSSQGGSALSSGSSFGGTGTPGGSGSMSGSGSTSGGAGSQSGSSFSGSGAPFLGVGLPVDGSAILVVNEKTTYPEWEFLYDPRIEQLKAKVNIFGGGMSSTSSSSLGALSGGASAGPGGSTSSGPGGSTPAQPTPTPTTP